ncbi:OmpA family protein [[Haemophilus] felis]|uniref:OmpA-like domain-containing protein n=1 Tax=[Haemophilus] felis TaxID=123822 RepID=A0A1T0AW66_9PAST|nr:OmpA family protein [[Haemophilus] felis]OOS01755.1 hypothetical protein B0188_09515 [[Haemophilus] felis]
MKLSRLLLATTGALSLVSCGSLSEITPEGSSTKLVWPKPEKATRINNNYVGAWTNWDNLGTIEAGMDKRQIFDLIGPPHFSEGFFGVREWDYVFNYREGGEKKYCQYKILFDREMIAQNFFWYPNGCNGNISFSLNGSLHFKTAEHELTPQGKQVVDKVAERLKKSPAKSVMISGYADLRGTAKGSLLLSQRRAESVKARLIEQGVELPITAVGYGETNSEIECKDRIGDTLAECLRKNRRVDISASGKEVKKTEPGKEAGDVGPTLLYKGKNNQTATGKTEIYNVIESAPMIIKVPTESKESAKNAKVRLIEKDITKVINALGYGEQKSLASCKGKTGDALKACLKLNSQLPTKTNETKK